MRRDCLEHPSKSLKDELFIATSCVHDPVLRQDMSTSHLHEPRHPNLKPRRGHRNLSVDQGTCGNPYPPNEFFTSHALPKPHLKDLEAEGSTGRVLPHSMGIQR